MKRKEWLPVRCCCTPTKIFGFLSVELGATTVLERSGRLHHIEVRSFSDCRPPPLRLVDGYVVEPTQEVSVELEKAVYSDDRPIQFWRSIDGFVEARDTKALSQADQVATMAKIRRLASKGYRDAYMASRVRSTIAIQIRMLRRSLGYSQTKFAHLIGTTQSVISDLEDPDGDQVSVQTLLKIAAAVNVALVVRFAGFPDFLKLMGDMSPAALAAENIDQTIGKQARAAPKTGPRGPL